MNETINQTTPTLPDVNVKVDIIPSISDLANLKESIINKINDLLLIFTPQEYVVYLLFIISIFIGLVLKKSWIKSEGDWAIGILLGIMIFFSLRFVGIGG